MWFEFSLPWWGWLLFGWVMSSVCFGAAIARWMRWLRD